MLAQFVQVLLSFFLLGNHFSVDLIEVSSDAFLAIICSEKVRYHEARNGGIFLLN